MSWNLDVNIALESRNESLETVGYFARKGLDDMQMNGPSKVPWDALLAASFDGNSFFGLE